MHYLKKYSAIVVLLLTGVATHLAWFLPNAILTHSDWYYWPAPPVKEIWYSWGSWLDFWNTGTSNIQLPYIIFDSVWSVLAKFGVSFDQSAKVTFLIPIAVLGFLAPFYLIRKLFGSQLVAFTGALFYGSTTYFLVKQTAHLPIALIYAALPALLLLFIRALEKNRIRDWLWFCIAFTIGIGYEVRIMLIVAAILAMCFFIFYDWKRFRPSKKVLTYLSIMIVVIAALNVYWILPTVHNTQAVSAVADRGLFGDFLFNIQHALTLHESSWTGGMPNEQFKAQSIPWFFWLYPIIAILPLLLRKHLSTNEKKTAVFFGMLAIIGIFLTKQSSAPFPASYAWLYNNIPGFVLFREASKFYMVTALGYLGLMSLTLIIMLRLLEQYELKPFYKRVVFYGPFAVILLLVGMNLKPLVIHQFGTMFVSRQKPQDYYVIDRFLHSQPSFFRTYWLPTYSRWSMFSNNHPEISAINEVNGEWKHTVDYTGHPANWPVQDQLTDNLSHPYSHDFFNNASVKYIFVPLKDTANDDDFFKYYGGSRQYYIRKLDATSWLHKINIGTKEIAVYENTAYQPHISANINATTLDSLSNSSAAASFLQSRDVLHPTFTDDKNAPSHLAQVKAIFSGTNALGYSRELSPDGQNQLFANAAATNVYYAATNSTINIYQAPLGGVAVDSQTPLLSALTSKKTLASVPLGNQSYLVDYNGTTFQVHANESSFLGVSLPNAPIDVYSYLNNLIPNGSFEKGLWQPTVEDCNNYDANGKVAMSLNTRNFKDGSRSLQLSATRHNACTHTTFSVTSKSAYVFRLNYQSSDAQQAGYYLKFNDRANTIIKDTLPIPNDSWQSTVRQITAPSGATNATLELYAYESDGHTRNDVNYDSISLYGRKVAAHAELPSSPAQYSGVPLQIDPGVHRFTYAGTEYDTANLIKNPSFEAGPWQSQVGDCNNYDSHASIAQRIDATDHTDGRASLVLSARKHTACTATSAPLSLPGAYLLSFDYRGAPGQQAGYNVTFNDPAHTTYNEQLPVASPGWAHETRRLSAPPGATAASVALYAYESDGQTTSNIGYDNVGLQKAPDLADDYFLYTPASQQLALPRSVAYQFINPSKYTAAVHGATKPFVLNFAESFNPGWKLYARPLQSAPCHQTIVYQTGQAGEVQECASRAAFVQKGDIGLLKTPPLFTASHFTLNGFANAWLIDPTFVKAHYSHAYYRENPDGSIDMNLAIYFTPQSYFYIGLVISGTTLAATLTALGYLTWRDHRRKVAKEVYRASRSDASATSR